MQKKSSSTPLNTNRVFVQAFRVCSLLESLDPSVVTGEKKQLGKNKSAAFLLPVVGLRAVKGLGILGPVVL